MSTSRLEQDLRDVLAERAWSVPATTDPCGRTTRAITADRRRRTILLTAAVAAVTVLATVPIGLIATLEAPDRTAARPPSTSGPIRLPDREIVDWRLSGDLAGSPDAVTQARADLELAAQRDPSVDGIQLLAVGSDDDGGPYLVGLARSSSMDTGYDYERVTVYIAGPGVAAASPAATLPADQVAGREVFAYTVAGGSTGLDYLLVAARPGIDRVEVSTGRRFGPDGVVERTYLPLELHNSVSLATLVDKPTDPTLRVRGYRGSTLMYDGFVTVARIAVGEQLAHGVLAQLAKDVGVGAAELGAAVRGVVTGYGLDLSGASARVIWRGRMDGSPGTAAVIELRLASGGRFQLVVQFAARHRAQVQLRQVRFLPATTAASSPIAWISDDPTGCRLTVVVPTGGAPQVDVRYVADSGTISAAGEAGDAVSIDRCARLPVPGQAGVLQVTDTRTRAELMRWDLRLPVWVYERTDVPSEKLGSVG